MNRKTLLIWTFAFFLALALSSVSHADTLVFSDDFSGDLSAWEKQQGTWTIKNGALKGYYSYSCGSVGCPQADIIAKNVTLSQDADWRLEASFTYSPVPGWNRADAQAHFVLWTDSSHKEVWGGGYGADGWDGTQRTDFWCRRSYWSNVWSEPVADQGLANVTWNPKSWNVLALEKRGTSFSLFLNGTLLRTYTGSRITGSFRPGLHVYGYTVVDSFKVYSLDGGSASSRLLYLKPGAPTTWTNEGAIGSQYREIQEWRSAGYDVTTMDLSNTVVTASLLSGYQALRLNSYGWGHVYSAAEGSTIAAWVNAGGRLFAELVTNKDVPAVSPFGVSRIDGQAGGSSGNTWYYHGAPWTFGPVAEPLGAAKVASEAMDHPVLTSGSGLTVDASVDGYPIVVHRAFGSGRVVITFQSGWSHDASWPTNSYQASIGEESNLQLLRKVIEYLGSAAPPSSCLAQRALAGYTAGQPSAVSILVTPPASTQSYALEDVPPPGWTVSAIDNAGVWDATNKKVKWGPFFDSQARTLNYSVTPPAGTTGTKSFTGLLSIDGASQKICGQQDTNPDSYHPADSNQNMRIELNEVTAYGAAWKTGASWPVQPSPIPIDYVTNAGLIWKSGEAYRYDPSRTPPFVPVPTGSVRTMAAFGSGTATCTLSPASYTPGSGVKVTITVAPAASTSAYAVEDAPPSGWTVSVIDNAGSWDAANKKVKWGPFFDNQSRTLTYTATAPAGETGAKSFSGTASFDGSSIPIGGARSISPASGPGPGGPGSAVSSFSPTSYAPGTLVRVTIVATPLSSTVAYAVEDTPPSGWAVSAIDNGGAWDASNRKAKWGPFFDNQARTLTYTATPPAGETGTRTFAGTASFDGQSIAVSGARSISDQGGGGGGGTLLLAAGRVSVSCTWRNQYNGSSGVGTPVRQLDQYGYFWFGSADNPEAFVKVLDFGTDSFLIFHTALSDFEYTVTLTVLRTGQSYSFVRQAGSSCGLVDTTTVKKVAQSPHVTPARRPDFGPRRAGGSGVRMAGGTGLEATTG